MTTSPLITIVTSSFNDCALLKETISNISAQAYSRLEYIVIDGGSQDGTLELLQGSNAVNDWISEPDKGIYDAWNKAVVKANGDYIAFLGAGDRYLDGGLEALVNLAVRDPDAEFIYGKVSLENTDQSSRLIGKTWTWSLFRRYMCTTHVGALHSRKLFDRYGLFNTNYKIAGDYELLLRPRQNLRVAFLDQPTAIMLAGGISQRNHDVLYEVKKAKLQHNTVSQFTAYYDFLIAFIKLYIRQKLLN
jgi:glycosyltransferase involved in cell wall biosynthesis